MRRDVLLLTVVAFATALAGDATLLSGGNLAGPPVFDSMLVKLDSIPSRSACQCIYVRNDTVFCMRQAGVVH